MGVFSAGTVPSVEMRKFNPDHYRLDRVQPEVSADDTVIVLLLTSVDPFDPQFLRQPGVPDRDDSPITDASQVFRGKEGKTAEVSHAANF